MYRLKISVFLLITLLFTLNSEVINLKKSKAAKVGDTIISVSQVSNYADTNKMSYEDALDELIEFEVLYLISKIYIDPPDEKRLNDAVNDDKQFYASHFRKNSDSITDREFLAAAGIGNKTMTDYIEYTKKKIMVSDYIYELTGSISVQSINITDAEVEKYISENSEKFFVDEKFEIMLINLSFFDHTGTQLPDDKIKEKAKKAAMAIEDLNNGISFSDCARKYSEDIFSLKSTPPGYFGTIEKKDEYIGKRFTENILNCFSESQPGVIKKVFATNDGFYIFKLLSKTPSRKIVGKEAHDMAINIITENKLEEKKGIVRMDKLKEFSKHFDVVRY